MPTERGPAHKVHSDPALRRAWRVTNEKHAAKPSKAATFRYEYAREFYNKHNHDGASDVHLAARAGSLQ